MVTDNLVTMLLPTLSRSLEIGFNVFDVMHHGNHEKQISNVFRWLLEADGTHGLGDAFARIFVDQVNHDLAERGLAPNEPFVLDEYWVRQEVNIAERVGGVDIADIVLETRSAAFVIENYYTSDGHDHGYREYLEYSQRDDRRGVVVMLCREIDRSRPTAGWQDAAVVTYPSVLEELHREIEADPKYRSRFPEPHSFIDQMYRKFVKGKGRMEDQQLLDFVVAMCDTGEASRYSLNRTEQVAQQFASDLAEQASTRFIEGRVLLQKVKDRLKTYSNQVLKVQLDAATSETVLRRVAANLGGKWQWAIVLQFEHAHEAADDIIELVFGPTAWHTQTELARGPDTNPDYSRIFLWHRNTKTFRPSAVTLQAVLDGLGQDTTLRDEILGLLPASAGNQTPAHSALQTHH